MGIARRLLLGLLIVLGLARMVGYLVYAAANLPSPLETYFLEAKMVLLAYRAELGETLYPEWRDYPHVANFFGPAYFGAVGLIGRAVGADIPGLFRIGRAVTFASGILTSLVVGVAVGRRYGRGAGVAGAVLSLGAAPMLGFSVMVRPDMAAEFVAVTGFFLSGGRSAITRIAGVALLVLAVLTKQTTGVFLVATSLAWVFEGEWRRGLRVGAGGLVALAAVVGAVTLLVEPNFAASLAEESKTPWEISSLTETLSRLWMYAPDMLYFPVLGLVLWATGATGRREARPATLAAILLATSVVTSAKRGADLNYYLSLRVVEGLAVGALWQAWSITKGWPRTAALAVATSLGCLATGYGTMYAIAYAQLALNNAQFRDGPRGQEVREVYRVLCAKAADPNSRILTDAGLIDLYQGKRAAFGDPWLFRMLAETGRIDPVLMRDRIDSQYYDLLITTSEIDMPSYDTYAFGLPKTLADRARLRYARLYYQAGLFFYGRRDQAASSPGPPAAGVPRSDRP